MFPSTPQKILAVCAVIIVIGLGILAIDRWVVKGDRPPEDQRIAALAEELGLTMRDDDASRATLRGLLEPFQATAGEPDDIGPVLTRVDGARTLWLFEYGLRKTAIARLGRPDIHAEVTLFGMLLELGPEQELPPWSQAENAAPPTPPHTLDSIARLGRLERYRMAMAGNRVLFVSTLDSWSLMQAVEQNTSDEFHPGLLNSAMKIDVQMALDIVDAMDTGMPPLERFYRVDIGPIDLPSPDASGLRQSLQENQRAIKEKLDADMAALREEMARQREENRAKFDATMKKFRENVGGGNRDAGEAE